MKRTLAEITDDEDVTTSASETCAISPSNNQQTSNVCSQCDDNFLIGNINQFDSRSLNKLLIGYLRNEFNNYNIKQNPCDIGTILFKSLFAKWEWDFICYSQSQEKLKQFSKNGLTISANNCLNDHTFNAGIWGINDIPMKPNTGIYTIKFEINNLDNCNCDYWGWSTGGGIGIAATQLNGLIRSTAVDFGMPAVDFNRRFDCTKYILWPFREIDGIGSYKYLKCGLLCGWDFYEDYDDDCDYYDSDTDMCDNCCHRNNIFIANRFKYASKNEYFKDRLPLLKKNDIITLLYDSNNNILFFKNENDNKLDAYIKNLPKNIDMYWMVAHDHEIISIAILPNSPMLNRKAERLSTIEHN